MTKLERTQDFLIKELIEQINQLCMMSKIELGDDVIERVNQLQDEIDELREVPNDIK